MPIARGKIIAIGIFAITVGAVAAYSTTRKSEERCPIDTPVECGPRCCPYGELGRRDVCCPDFSCTTNGRCPIPGAASGGAAPSNAAPAGCPNDKPIPCGSACCPFGSGGRKDVCCPNDTCTMDGECHIAQVGDATISCPKEAPLVCGHTCCPAGDGGRLDVCCPDGTCSRDGECAAARPPP